MRFPKSKVAVWQFDSEKANNRGFMKFMEFAHNIPAFAKYDSIVEMLNDLAECVYRGEERANCEDFQVCQNLFAKTNNGPSRPEGWKGHSLSVSDIVEINGRFYYCEPIGWKNLNRTLGD